MATAAFHLLGCNMHKPLFLKPDCSEHEVKWSKAQSGAKTAKNLKPFISKYQRETKRQYSKL